MHYAAALIQSALPWVSQPMLRLLDCLGTTEGGRVPLGAGGPTAVSLLGELGSSTLLGENVGARESLAGTFGVCRRPRAKCLLPGD